MLTADDMGLSLYGLQILPCETHFLVQMGAVSVSSAWLSQAGG